MRPGTACAGSWHQQGLVELTTVDASGKLKGLMIWRCVLVRYRGMWAETHWVQKPGNCIGEQFRTYLALGCKRCEFRSWLGCWLPMSGQEVKRDLAFTEQSSRKQFQSSQALSCGFLNTSSPHCKPGTNIFFGIWGEVENKCVYI